MNNLKMKAVLYLRVSTEEQVDNFSLGTQEEICTREAQFRGYSVAKVFREEGRSAKTIKGRDALNELLEYCRKNRKDVDAVFVYKTDRLSRQIFDYLIIQKKLSDFGVKLISATEPTDDTAMGRFLGNFFAQIAQFDNDIRSERARNGMYARFKSGLYHNGKPPIGYLSIDSTVVQDPKTFEKIKTAWDLMATGTKTLREIREYLDSFGISLAKSSIHRMFRSKFYTGQIYSPTYQEESQGQHIPMISRAQFNKVQSILNGRYPQKPALSKRNLLNPDFPLRRFIKCGKCGLAFTGSWSRGRGGRYAYYFCWENKKCNSPYVSVKRIHYELNSLMVRIEINKAGKMIFLSLLEDEFEKRSSILKQKESRFVHQLKKLRDLQLTLIQKHMAGLYSDEIFKEQNDLLEGNIQSCRVLSDNQFVKAYTLPSAKEFILNLIYHPVPAYNASDIGKKKQLLSLLFPKGCVWNYPGLTFPEIGPFFTVKPAKILD